MARKNRLIWIPGILGTSGWVGLVSPAHAGYYTAYSIDKPWGPAIQNAVIPLSFQTFDTSLGVLTGVSIGGNTSMTAELAILNFNAYPLNITNGFVSEPVQVTNGNGTNFAETVNQTVTAGNLSGIASAAVSPAPVSVTDFPGNTTNVAFSPAVIGSAEFATFESPGGNTVITINVNTGSASEGCNVGNGVSAHTWSSGAEVTVLGDVAVTYTYFVPEPGSLGLIILGGSITMSRRRRSKRYQKKLLTSL